MEIFGFSCLKIKRTGAGSLRIEQVFSVPLELAHRASGAYYVVPELNWGSAAHKPLWGLKESQAAIHELLQDISQRSPVELMQLSQNLSQQSELERIKIQLGLSREDLAIPQGKDQPYRDRWQAVLWKLLSQKAGPAERLQELNGVCNLNRVEGWLRQNTVSSGQGQKIPLVSPHSLDLYSPDLKRRVLLRQQAPFAGLWVEESGEQELIRYASRKEMLRHVEKELDRPAATELSLAAPHLKTHWLGQPIEARLININYRSSLRLKLGKTSRESTGQEVRGYLKEAKREGSLLEQQMLDEVAGRVLPSGLTQPGVKPVKSRPARTGRIICSRPENPYA